MDKSYYEDVLDIAIKHAGRDILEDMALEKTPGADEDLFSEGFEKKMKKLISAERKKQRTSKTLKVMARIAAVIAVLLIVSSAVIFSSEALRAKVMNLFYSTNSESVDINFEDVGNMPAGLVLPGYVPDGFTLSEAKQTGHMYSSLYEDTQGGFIRIKQTPGGGSSSIDNKENVFEREYKGVKIIVSETDDQDSVVFNYGAYDYLIMGNIDSSELLKVAESIIK